MYMGVSQKGDTNLTDVGNTGSFALSTGSSTQHCMSAWAR